MPESMTAWPTLTRTPDGGTGFDFGRYPKQFVISRNRFESIVNGKSAVFAGWSLQAAQNLPIIELQNREGGRIGLLAGWPIHRGRLLKDDEALPDADRFSAEIFPDLAGRFICLWLEKGALNFRLDAGGSLPAVFDRKLGLITSTPTLIAHLSPRKVDLEVARIFNFPAQRGFLPFGLTHWTEVERLLPGHVLAPDTGTLTRVWPDPAFLQLPRSHPDEVQSLVEEAAGRVKAQVSAIAGTGQSLLYLSGGHDSRMILAAARDHGEKLVCETAVDASSLDAHVASKVAQVAGVHHVLVQVPQASEAEVEACLDRTGYSLYDVVTRISAIAPHLDRGRYAIDGTGAEITRGSNWSIEDVEAPFLTSDTLLKRLRMPNVPIVRRAGEAWLRGLPEGDAARNLDLAKIEQIHGCWAAPAIYGHMTDLPSISPFCSQRIYEIALRLPKDYKMSNGFYYDFISILWPELLEVPVNRATGFDRVRFFKQEVKRLMPTKLKRWLKPLR